MKKIFSPKGLLVILCLISIFVGCSEGNSLNSNMDELNSTILNASLRNDKSKNAKELFTISYEIDITTITEFDCDPTNLDIAAGSPLSDKQKIEMTVKENGAVKLITESLPSRNSFDIAHKSLPNDLPEISKTILDNGEMKLYDNSGSLIRTIAGQSIDIPLITNEINDILSKLDSSEDIGNFIACNRSNISFDSLANLIVTEPYNVNVKRMSDDIYTIRKQATIEGANSELGYVVNIVDVSNKRLIASRLYDENEEILQTMMYQYENCVLKGFRQEITQELPNCDKATLLSFAEISNLDFKYLK